MENYKKLSLSKNPLDLNFLLKKTFFYIYIDIFYIKAAESFSVFDSWFNLVPGEVKWEAKYLQTLVKDK